MKYNKCFIGQKITAKKNNPYAITTNKAIMKITQLNGEHKEENMRVKILKHKTRTGRTGNSYPVNSKHFIPVKNSIKKI